MEAGFRQQRSQPQEEVLEKTNDGKNAENMIICTYR